MFKTNLTPNSLVDLTARQKTFASDWLAKDHGMLSPQTQFNRNYESQKRCSLKDTQRIIPMEEYTNKLAKTTGSLTIHSTTISRLQHTLQKAALARMTNALGQPNF